MEKERDIASHNRKSVMLTTTGVARLLNVHINTVRRWSNRGILKAYRIGPRGDRRFKREEIDSFLTEGFEDILGNEDKVALMRR